MQTTQTTSTVPTTTNPSSEDKLIKLVLGTKELLAHIAPIMPTIPANLPKEKRDEAMQQGVKDAVLKLVAFLSDGDNAELSSKLAAMKFSPEKAIMSPRLLPVIVKGYSKYQADKALAEVVQDEDAALALLEEGLLGITQEDKDRKAIADWVFALHQNKVTEWPVPNTDDKGHHFCAVSALGIPCCPGKEYAKGFSLTYDENGQLQPYGLCGNVIEAFKAAANEHGKSPRLYVMNLGEASRRVQEAQDRVPVKEWIYTLANGRVKDLPIVRKTEVEEKLLCGVPHCKCGHDQPTQWFHAYNGEVYGVCMFALPAFWDCFNDTQLKRVKPTKNIAEARGAANHQNKMKPLLDWVRRFATGETAVKDDDGNDEEPIAVRNDDGVLMCGARHCCDHTQQAVGFTHFQGVKWGVCKDGAWALAETRSRYYDPEYGDPNCPDVLMFTKDEGQADWIAQQWINQNSTEANPSAGNAVPRSPLGNETSDSDRARRERNLKNRRDADHDRWEKTHGPSGGGGGKGGQRQGRR